MPQEMELCSGTGLEQRTERTRNFEASTFMNAKALHLMRSWGVTVTLLPVAVGTRFLDFPRFCKKRHDEK